MWKTYHTPTTLGQALELLAAAEQQGKRARAIAGGTDIIIELERKLRQVDMLVDLTRIAGLDQIKAAADGTLHIGPLVTHNQLVASPLVVERAFPLAQACWSVGAPQIRNRGTLAGNLITASPANDTITPLRVLDARVKLASAAGERIVPLADFYQGVRRTAMRADELLVDIMVPPLPAGARGTFLKLGLRRAQAISVINVAVVLNWDGDVVNEARIAAGSVAPTIVRAPEAEAFLLGKSLSDEVVDEAACSGRAGRPAD